MAFCSRFPRDLLAADGDTSCIGSFSSFPSSLDRHGAIRRHGSRTEMVVDLHLRFTECDGDSRRLYWMHHCSYKDFDKMTWPNPSLERIPASRDRSVLSLGDSEHRS